MKFRRTSSRQEVWRTLVQQHQLLLTELPAAALVNENVFREYVTRGLRRDVVLTPSVFEISAKARADLFDFMHGKAHFDMDVTSFDHFNEAFRTDHV